MSDIIEITEEDIFRQKEEEENKNLPNSLILFMSKAPSPFYIKENTKKNSIFSSEENKLETFCQIEKPKLNFSFVSTEIRKKIHQCLKEGNIETNLDSNTTLSKTQENDNSENSEDIFKSIQKEKSLIKRNKKYKNNKNKKNKYLFSIENKEKEKEKLNIIFDNNNKNTNTYKKKNLLNNSICYCNNKIKKKSFYEEKVENSNQNDFITLIREVLNSYRKKDFKQKLNKILLKNMKNLFFVSIKNKQKYIYNYKYSYNKKDLKMGLDLSVLLERGGDSFHFCLVNSEFFNIEKLSNMTTEEILYYLEMNNYFHIGLNKKMTKNYELITKIKNDPKEKEAQCILELTYGEILDVFCNKNIWSVIKDVFKDKLKIKNSYFKNSQKNLMNKIKNSNKKKLLKNIIDSIIENLKDNIILKYCCTKEQN